MNDRIPKEEIEKWLNRIKKELKMIKARDKRGKEFLDNISAYVKDCEHFLEKGEYVLSFESIIWAWAYLEISRDLKLLK
jgi:hypothetical protein